MLSPFKSPAVLFCFGLGVTEGREWLLGGSEDTGSSVGLSVWFSFSASVLGGGACLPWLTFNALSCKVETATLTLLYNVPTL